AGMSFYDKQGASTSGPGFRRTWDTKEYEAKAMERLNAERDEAEGKAPKGPRIKRELLQSRDYKVDLESKIGKAVVINKATPSAETGGYYCDVCDCTVKDSINFLDHINGKNHQKNMGMSMKVKKSTVEEVKERLLVKKIEREQARFEANAEEQAEDVKEEEARLADHKAVKRENRKRKKEKEDAAEEMDPEMAAMMGFGGFGGSKKNK
ncbi:hypothetical protein PFISCL1PPCAC_12341, partial [Pristionchus fissidentatus]